MKFNTFVTLLALYALAGGIFSVSSQPLCSYYDPEMQLVDGNSDLFSFNWLLSKAVTMNVTDCTKSLGGTPGAKYTDIEYALNELSGWTQVTCGLIIDGQGPTQMSYMNLPPNIVGGLSGTKKYQSGDDGVYGCGQHTISVVCFNARYNLSQATEVVYSQQESFTCTNCCSVGPLVGGLVCADNCGKLTPPAGQFYSCISSSCSCQLDFKTVYCTQGSGNSNGEYCMDDCREGKFCNSGCLCQDIPAPKACSDGNSTLFPKQQCIDDCPQTDLCNAQCQCEKKPPVYVKCSAGTGNLSGEVCQNDCPGGFTCNSSCICEKLPPPIVKCSWGTGNVTNGFACNDDCASGFQCNSSCMCEPKPVEEVLCSSGTGNSSGQLCIDDCASGFQCNSTCKCEVKPPTEVLCSSGIGNSSGQLCIDDCADGFSCNFACKCEKLPPTTVSCSSGVGNSSGQFCRNDCDSGLFCNNECICEPLPDVVYCSQGGIAPGLVCIDDCTSALGSDFYCETTSCTCKQKAEGELDTAPIITFSTWRK